MKKSTKVILVILITLILDQVLKIWVKTSFEYGEEVWLFGWSKARLHFVENNGMAFGMTLGEEYGKIALSSFRILAVIGLTWYIRTMLRRRESFGLIISFSLILAGALGNIIDSAFYGLIFSESPYHGGVATVFPEGGGYASFLHGKVVDMLYFPMFKTTLPAWLPGITPDKVYTFFSPVFNLADVAITLGVFNMLFFETGFFTKRSPEHGALTAAGETLVDSAITTIEETVSGK